MNAETFFRSLPADEFQIFETDLREALINAAAKAKDLGLPQAKFPLQAWINKRLGEEVAASCRDGFLEISLVAGSSERFEDFFSTLQQDSFSQEEADLRMSIFDFLASWQSSELATAKDLSMDANVRACADKFLPPSVQLADWIERRIGGEVEIHKGIVNLLCPEARKIVSDKYQALEARKEGHGSAVPARYPQPGAKGKGKQAVESKDQFFQTLPPNELTGPEVLLRQALLDWHDAWARRGGKGLRGQAPLLGDAMNDSRVTQCRMRLLPKNISLKDWIEARIGGELELRDNPRGQVEVVRGGEANQDPNGILDSLPEDALNEKELDLRSTVLQMLSSTRYRLPQLSQAPQVLAAKRKFLPDEVPLSEWIDRRIGGEVEITSDNWVRARGAEPVKEEPASQGPPGFKGKDQSKGKDGKGKNGKAGKGEDSSRHIAENFFKTLPEMNFTEQEEALRDAILCFLENWVEEEPPTLSKAMLDPDVRSCKLEVLPKGNVVSLKEWIERRLGGELEIVRNETGNLVIGICGDADPQPTKREAADDWEQSPGKVPRHAGREMS